MVNDGYITGDTIDLLVNERYGKPPSLTIINHCLGSHY